MVKRSLNHKHNVTVMGALSSTRPGTLFYGVVSTTNSDNVLKFFEAMSEQHNLAGSIVVLDNHRAHLSHSVRQLFRDLKCRLLFLPPASSILNPIESVWSLMKREWRKKLVVTSPKNMSEKWMETQLLEIC